MNNTQDNKMQNIFRYVSAFLGGAVLGIAGFAYWALQAGVLQSGPLVQILLPIGLFVGIFFASLPSLIEQMMAALTAIGLCAAKNCDGTKRYDKVKKQR